MWRLPTSAGLAEWEVSHWEVEEGGRGFSSFDFLVDSEVYFCLGRTSGTVCMVLGEEDGSMA